MFKDRNGDGEWKVCFEMEAELDFDDGGYFLVSSSSGFVNEDYHKINSFKVLNP